MCILLHWVRRRSACTTPKGECPLCVSAYQEFYALITIKYESFFKKTREFFQSVRNPFVM